MDAIRQAQEGAGDSARTQVRRLLAATSPTDTLYPQIIYTQAMVASDANEMRRQLQRVAVEYSSSSWADDALLRLVQLDYASGNLPGAARNLERLRLDYPGSTLLPQAAYWAARTYFDQKNPELACRWMAEGLAGIQRQRRAAEPARLSRPALRRGPSGRLSSRHGLLSPDWRAGEPIPPRFHRIRAGPRSTGCRSACSHATALSRLPLRLNPSPQRRRHLAPSPPRG